MQQLWKLLLDQYGRFGNDIAPRGAPTTKYVASFTIHAAKRSAGRWIFQNVSFSKPMPKSTPVILHSNVFSLFAISYIKVAASSIVCTLTATDVFEWKVICCYVFNTIYTLFECETKEILYWFYMEVVSYAYKRLNCFFGLKNWWNKYNF